uniref:Arabinogalactan peptide 3 n=1 Tax=Leersia perrieri TaxID=77586 RepID=A0A0D9WJ84_9ORYZ
MASKIFYAAVVAAVAVSSLAGVAFAADSPAPSPTSGAAAVSSSIVAAVLCPAVALLLRQ